MVRASGDDVGNSSSGRRRARRALGEGGTAVNTYNVSCELDDGDALGSATCVNGTAVRRGAANATNSSVQPVDDPAVTSVEAEVVATNTATGIMGMATGTARMSPRRRRCKFPPRPCSSSASAWKR